MEKVKGAYITENIQNKMANDEEYNNGIMEIVDGVLDGNYKVVGNEKHAQLFIVNQESHGVVWVAVIEDEVYLELTEDYSNQVKIR